LSTHGTWAAYYEREAAGPDVDDSLADILYAEEWEEDGLPIPPSGEFLTVPPPPEAVDEVDPDDIPF
jgi:hypothetical protein